MILPHVKLHILPSLSSHEKHSTSYEMTSSRLSVLSGLFHFMVIPVVLCSISGLLFNASSAVGKKDI